MKNKPKKGAAIAAPFYLSVRQRRRKWGGGAPLSPGRADQSALNFDSSSAYDERELFASKRGAAEQGAAAEGITMAIAALGEMRGRRRTLRWRFLRDDGAAKGELLPA